MPNKKKTNKSGDGKIGLIIIAIILAAGIAAVLLVCVLTGQTPKATIEYSDKDHNAKIILENGKTENINVPTVEKIDASGEVTKSEDLPDVGQGAWRDTSSYIKYKNAVMNQCIDVDGYFGSQCFDLASDFWRNYTGRWLSSCGTGAARGTTNCWKENAGSQFVMIWNAKDIQPGDWLVFDSGQYGHIGMALGYNNDGYVTLLGQNQGGEACPNGGSKANIINISLSTFRGAFRPKAYIKPAPAPVVNKVDVLPGCPVGTKLTLKKGDTLGQIMINCTGEVKWGQAMNDYATTWESTVVKPGQIVLDGWNTYPGVGLWQGDTIERIK